MSQDQLNENQDGLKNSEFLSIENDEYPYSESIRELEKIDSCKSLRDKFDYVVSSNTLMKMKVIDFHNGKEEVCSMDDELPIIIFIVLHAKIKNPFCQINLVDDYLSAFPDFEIEKRFLLNMKVYYFYFF